MGKGLEWKRLWHPTINLLCKVYISLSTFYVWLVANRCRELWCGLVNSPTSILIPAIADLIVQIAGLRLDSIYPGIIFSV